MDDCHFGYIKKFPKNKNTASSEHKKNGDGKGQDFSLQLLVENAPNNPPPQQLLVKPELKTEITIIVVPRQVWD